LGRDHGGASGERVEHKKVLRAGRNASEPVSLLAKAITDSGGGRITAGRLDANQHRRGSQLTQKARKYWSHDRDRKKSGDGK